MNPKEEAERIVACFVPTIRCVINDYHDKQKEFVKEGAKQCAIIAVEMLIEANPSKKKIVGFNYPNDYLQLPIYELECDLAHYKEVLKAIKNME